MASNVVKKDGTKEPFDAEKIRKAIVLAAGQVGLAEKRKNEIAEQVAATLTIAEDNEEITTSEIREKILNELDSIEPTVSAAWRKYDQERKGA